MIIKDQFELVQNMPNLLSIPSSALKKVQIDDGPYKIESILNLMKSRVNHFSKDKVYDLISDKKEWQRIHVVNIPNYLLQISYNKPTKGIVFNLSPFGLKDILPTNPGPQNLYAALVYGICLRELIIGKKKVKEAYASIITSYLTSLFVRLFGKEYGLLGSFSDKIAQMKFLVSCYVLSSFFGISGDKAFKMSVPVSGFSYKDIHSELKRYKFDKISELIKSFSDFGVLPGINKHLFTSKVLKLFQFSFLPALEDLSRFISILTTSDISGSSLVPTFLYKYNESSYNRILEISKGIFRR